MNSDKAIRRQSTDPLQIDRVGAGKGCHLAWRNRSAPPRPRHADRLVADSGPGASPHSRLHGHGTRSLLRHTGPTRGGVEKRRLPSGPPLQDGSSRPRPPPRLGSDLLLEICYRKTTVRAFRARYRRGPDKPPGPIELELIAARCGGPGQTRGTTPVDRLPRPPGDRHAEARTSYGKCIFGVRRETRAAELNL